MKWLDEDIDWLILADLPKDFRALMKTKSKSAWFQYTFLQYVSFKKEEKVSHNTVDVG